MKRNKEIHWPNTCLKCINWYLERCLAIDRLSLNHVTFGGGCPRTLHTILSRLPSFIVALFATKDSIYARWPVIEQELCMALLLVGCPKIKEQILPRVYNCMKNWPVYRNNNLSINSSIFHDIRKRITTKMKCSL